MSRLAPSCIIVPNMSRPPWCWHHLQIMIMAMTIRKGTQTGKYLSFGDNLKVHCGKKSIRKHWNTAKIWPLSWVSKSSMNSLSQRTVPILSFLKSSKLNKTFRLTSKNLASILYFCQYIFLHCSSFSDNQQKVRPTPSTSNIVYFIWAIRIQGEPKGARIWMCILS